MSPQEEKTRTYDQPEEIVLVDSVTEYFGGKAAVKDLSFGVPAGQICGITGSERGGQDDALPALDGHSESNQWTADGRWPGRL